MTAPTHLVTRDITSLTCSAQEQGRTIVNILDNDGPKHRWLVLGPCSVSRFSDRADDIGSWILESKFADGTTDCDHSTCVAIRLPIIGLTLQGIRHGVSHLVAYIDSNLEAEIGAGTSDNWFRVPDSDWDPRKAKGAYKCTTCTEERKGHIVVPDEKGMYIPKFNPQLYQAVRGKKIQILSGAMG